MENVSGSSIPWEDLKYIFGEIIYGGHIVNDFDRLLTNTYLDHFMRQELLDEMELYPYCEGSNFTFKSPVPSNYSRYINHIDEGITKGTPIAFGLHPNAEIDFRTTQSSILFNTLIKLQPRQKSNTIDEDQVSPEIIASNVTQEILETYQDILLDIEGVEDSLEEKGPYQNVFIQECNAMNTLLKEIKRSLNELRMGFQGELTMSDAMENLMECLFMNIVPASWTKLAWPSLRNLSSWNTNLMRRIEQLNGWCDNPMEIPRVTWISGLINPTSFLTAIKQVSAQATKQPLDKKTITTDVTKRNIEECDQAARDGAYVYGLSMQGARWNIENSTVEVSRPKEMYCPMPVITCKAIRADKQQGSNIFMCPCYKTEQRGPTYVFCAQLKTKSPPARWIMAGVCLVMDIVD